MSESKEFAKWINGHVPEYDDTLNVGSLRDIALVAWNAAANESQITRGTALIEKGLKMIREATK